MGDSLNPSVMSRLLAALRPDWSRTLAARRVAAGALVVLAAVVALRSNPQGDRTEIVVASRDLAPGVELTADDVRLENRMAATVPDGSQSDVDTVIGATLAGPARRGEVLTDVRVLGPRLAESVAGPDARIVPLPLADSALLDLVRPGDVVDVLAAGAEASTAAGLMRDHSWWRPTPWWSWCPRSRRALAAEATAWCWWLFRLTRPTTWRPRRWCRP